MVRHPNADLDQVFGLIGDKMELDIISGLNARDLEGMSTNGDFAIPIGSSCVMQAKDILGGSKGFGEGKGAKEQPLFFLSLFEPHGGDFVSGRMDLVVIVAMDFFA